MCQHEHQSVILDREETALLFVKEGNRVFYDLDSLLAILYSETAAEIVATADDITDLTPGQLMYFSGQQAVLESLTAHVAVFKAHGEITDDALAAFLSGD